MSEWRDGPPPTGERVEVAHAGLVLAGVSDGRTFSFDGGSYIPAEKVRDWRPLAVSIDDDPIIGTIIVCAGPPACMLEGDAAVEAQTAGCLWCKTIDIYASGREVEKGPGHA